MYMYIYMGTKCPLIISVTFYKQVIQSIHKYHGLYCMVTVLNGPQLMCSTPLLSDGNGVEW